MLSALHNIAIATMTAYLALTNTIADQLAILIDQYTPTPVEVVDTPTETAPASPIPLEDPVDFLAILANGNGHQEAAVIESSSDIATSTVATTTESTGVTVQPTDIEGTLKAAIVNIYCTYTTGRHVQATTGTGFFVRNNGVILTNAHVALFSLLENVKDEGTTECVVRTGDPATAEYHAKLLYISPTWVSNNADVLTETTPLGNGQQDYALLYVTDRLDGSALPTTFPHLSVSTALIDNQLKGAPVTIGGYPVFNIDLAGGSLQVSQSIATSSVKHVYTFTKNYGDLISVDGAEIGVHGISGGPVVNEAGQAIGVISTKENDAGDDYGDLNAITISYIDRALLSETGFGFYPSTSGDLKYRAEIFYKTLEPFLSSFLINQLQ